jgi:phage-related baseplate assembly protein
MPSKYGYISKAYVDQALSVNPDTDRVEQTNNSLSLDVYILSTNVDNKLTNAGFSIKRNLKTYLSQFKMLTDAINIKDAYYINIGINFEIQVLQGFNSQQVLLAAITSLQQYFDINKWSINQPIILSQVENAISCAGVNGVAAVKKLEFINKTGGNYSPYAYDLNGATLNGVIYPSLDPSIFEIRYPNSDIIGRVVGM